MEMKYVVPDMAQSFGTLEFAGESEPIFERDKNNRRVLARRSYNLYSDVQKGENVVVEIPVQAGEKKFKYEQKVKLVNPKLYGRGYAIGDKQNVEKVVSQETRQNYTKDRRTEVQQTQSVQKNQQTTEKSRNLVTKKGQKKK
ncbi:YdcP family protein [Eubacterium ramulus]|nr:DUF961 domain-containing protein [Eubacterium ramulus]